MVLTGVYVYARMQSLAGQGLAESSSQDGAGARPRRSFRSALAASGPARHVMAFKMRDGSRVRCRIVDGGGLLSVHVDRDYEVPGVEWSKVHTIVDVGAHVGTFTIWAALRAPLARCLAVEPNPNSFRLLVENIRDNGLQERVKAVNAAAGPRPGIGHLELVEHSLGTRLARNGGGGLSVNVQSIDNLLSENGLQNVDVFKIDCEGMEYEIFKALSAGRLRAINAVMCEYHPVPGHDAAELDGILRSAGFLVERPNAAQGVLTATRSG
ncbi:MAG: FkbM family methyltransferase [Candidatus Dormibacterales bacterium]